MSVIMGKIGVDDGGDDGVEVDGGVANDVDWGWRAGGNELEMRAAGLSEEGEEGARGDFGCHFLRPCAFLIMPILHLSRRKLTSLAERHRPLWMASFRPDWEA